MGPLMPPAGNEDETAGVSVLHKLAVVEEGSEDSADTSPTLWTVGGFLEVLGCLGLGLVKELVDKGQGQRPRCGYELEKHSPHPPKPAPGFLDAVGEKLGAPQPGACLARSGSGETGTREGWKGDSRPGSWEQP